MQAFATREDLAIRWNRTFTAEQVSTVDARLMDASAFISTRLNRAGLAIDPTNELQAYNLKWVCCDIARRSLAPMLDAGQGGGSNFTQAPLNGYMQTAGAFTEQFQFANPMGDMYLLKTEESALGLSGMRFRTIPVAMENR